MAAARLQQRRTDTPSSDGQQRRASEAGCRAADPLAHMHPLTCDRVSQERTTPAATLPASGR
jgi:hypothetical protein